MAALVCDICGGKLLMGSGGIATCGSCGMAHSADRMKEKVQEIKGTVRVDNSHMIENYLEMAQNAYDSGNKSEAESYANKIIEIDPNNYQAWFLKGKSAGWQSTLSNPRFSEAINCFANAIQNTDEEKKEDLIEECKDEISSLSEALIRLRGERFEKYPDADECAGFIKDAGIILQSILQFFTASNVLIDKDALVSPLATSINNSVIASWNNTIVPDYINDNEGHPDDYELKRLIERADYCTRLIEFAIGLCDTDDVSDINRYENLISIHQYMLNAKSYQYKTVQVGNSSWDGSAIYDNRYVESKSLTESAKSNRLMLITEYKAKIEAIRKPIREQEAAEKAAKIAKEKKDREDAYNSFWAAYASEKETLTEELQELMNKRSALQKASTGHMQIQLIEQRMTEIKNVLEKDRRGSSKNMNDAEQSLLTGKSKFWEKLNTTEDYDAYLDKYPILKEKTILEKKAVELNNTLSDIKKAPPVNHWGGRITGMMICLALAAVIVTSGARMTGIIILILIGFLAGAFFCVFGAIRNSIKYKSNVSKHEYDLKKCNEKLVIIAQIPVYGADKSANANSFVAYDQKVEDEKNKNVRKKKKTLILIISIVIAIVVGLSIYFLILEPNRIESENQAAYAAAVTAFEGENYAEAATLFAAIPSVNDSKSYLRKDELKYFVPGNIVTIGHYKKAGDTQSTAPEPSYAPESNPTGSVATADITKSDTIEPIVNGEDIQWIVLDVLDGKTLLISKDYLEYLPYNEREESVNWEDCSLREWLNSTFYFSAFTEEERNAILVTETQYRRYSYGDDYTTVENSIFLLKESEREQYFEGQGLEWGGTATAYAKAIQETEGNYAAAEYAWYLSDKRDKYANTTGDWSLVYYAKYVRPVMWIDASLLK